MIEYLDFLKHIKNTWLDKGDRTWTWTRSVFGYQMRFDLAKGFPILTTKKVFLKWIIHELLWFLSWDTSIKYLVDNNVHIWDAWPYAQYKKEMEVAWEKYLSQEEFIEKIASEDSQSEFVKKWWDLWPVYWYQWRNFNGQWIDQIQKVIDTINNNPNCRRNLVVAYNPAQVENMALPPCHSLFQFYVSDWKLSCQLYQRSADALLWVPFNIASYALLVMMVAQVTNLKLWDFVHTFGDAHIYKNHFEQVDLQLSRTPKTLPEMKLNKDVKNIFDFKYEDFELVNYDPYPAIKAPISV